MNIIIFSVQASLILLAALAICGIGRRQSAAWRSTILIVAIAAAAAVPLFAAAAPRLGLTFSLPQIPATFLSEVQPETSSPPATEVQSSPIEAPPVSLSTTPSSPKHSAGTIPALWPYLWAIWLAGLAFGMLRILYGRVRLKRVESAAEPAQTQAIETIAAETRQRYGLKRPVTILRSHEPPVTWGALRPKLLLPAEARQWTEERLRIVIGHEFAHISRGDWTFQMLAEIQRAIFWFNPLWWIALRRLVEECERAADDFALSKGIAGVDNMAYAEELLVMARTFAAPRVAGGGRAQAPGGALKKRL
jgi:beta-lactamase regulating signal transducer with metallopeptidase domain